MRYSIFFLAPVAVLSAVVPGPASGGDPQTGGLCCTRNGVADPSGTCKAMGLDSFACNSIAKNDDPAFSGESSPKGGCDKPEVAAFPVGRDVKGFVAGSKDTIPVGPDPRGQTFNAFIGCA
ncbi:hypothetical protein LX36DRAFT_592753 [Colletotrichum falcatum]|nr:hypothetical protein LX36DRAFT_592753 [Colletotrichum falcatum]